MKKLLLASTISLVVGISAFSINIDDPCPSSPNCVSTLADTNDAQHYVEPIRYTGSPEEALAAAREALLALPRTTIVSEVTLSVTAESRSLLFKLVDDVTVVVDPATGLLHFKSASRLGYSDLGVNRRRYEAFRRIVLEIPGF